MFVYMLFQIPLESYKIEQQNAKFLFSYRLKAKFFRLFFFYHGSELERQLQKYQINVRAANLCEKLLNETN